MRNPGILAAVLLAVPLARAAEPVLPDLPRVPVESIPPALRAKVRLVLDAPSVSLKGTPETVRTATDVYRWLLDNPPVSIRLWRELGAKVSDVAEVSPGVFHWTDGQGNEVVWQAVVRAPGLHVWHAEGKAKPSVLLPASSFKAVCVLHYAEGKDPEGKPLVRHQAHFHARCDGRVMSLAARVLGGSVPRLGEQYLGQLQTFYGGLGWYLTQDPPRARKMLAKIGLLPAGTE